jgi:predicted nucleotidyltransferase
MTGPTQYEDLNGVLAKFLEGVQEILAESLCGVYLQGSFALGDADEHSDVDFIVVTQNEVTEGQASGLQAMHERLYGLESPWAQHLEGSYISTESCAASIRPDHPFSTWTTARPSSSTTTTATRLLSAGPSASAVSSSQARIRRA